LQVSLERRPVDNESPGRALCGFSGSESGILQVSLERRPVDNESPSRALCRLLRV